MAKKASDGIKIDLKKYSDLEALANSAGGKVLKDACLADIVSCLEMFAYTTKVPTLEEYIQMSAKLNEKLSTYRTLINAKKNIKLAKIALEEALEEEGEE